MATDTLVLERPIKIINLWKETRKRGTGRASRRVVLNCTRGLYSRTRARVKNRVDTVTLDRIRSQTAPRYFWVSLLAIKNFYYRTKIFLRTISEDFSKDHF